MTIREISQFNFIGEGDDYCDETTCYEVLLASEVTFEVAGLQFKAVVCQHHTNTLLQEAARQRARDTQTAQDYDGEHT